MSNLPPIVRFVIWNPKDPVATRHAIKTRSEEQAVAMWFDLEYPSGSIPHGWINVHIRQMIGPLFEAYPDNCPPDHYRVRWVGGEGLGVEVERA